MKYKKRLAIEKILNNFDDSEANKINESNEKILSKELKNIIKNNNINTNINKSSKTSGGGLKRRPINTSVLI